MSRHRGLKQDILRYDDEEEQAVASRDSVLEVDEVRRSSGRQTLVAVNADRRESDFDRIDAETIALWQATGAAESAAATAGAPAGQRREPWPLWPYLLFFLAAITIAESIYATRYLTREEAA